MKFLKSAFIYCYMLLLFCNVAFAGARIVPVNTSDDFLLARPGLNGGLSCDMIETPVMGGRLCAIAFNMKVSANTQKAAVAIFHSNGGSTVISVTGATSIDVVIGNDTAAKTKGKRFVVYMVYSRPLAAGKSEVILRRCLLSNITSSGMTIQTSAEIPLVRKNNAASNPRVDLFVDPSHTYGSMPLLHEFAITWSNDNSDSLFIARGNVNTSTAPTPVAFYVGNGRVTATDVGAQISMHNNKKIAHIGFIQSPDSVTHILKVAHVDFSASTPSLVSTTTVKTFSSAPVGISLEAMAKHNALLGGVKWNLLLETDSQVIYDYNDVQLSGINCSSLAALKGIRPVVAAGLGLLDNQNYFANIGYIASWYSPSSSGGRFLSQYVNAATGVRFNDTNYYQVNAFTTATHYLAVSSASNSGNSILATWGDTLSNIYYKIGVQPPSGQKPGFEDNLQSLWDMDGSAHIPLSFSHDIELAVDKEGYYEINGTIAHHSDISLNPNPASDHITVSNADGALYAIADLTGRTIKTGIVRNQYLTITDLAPGQYIISFIKDGNRTYIRFFKESI